MGTLFICKDENKCNDYVGILEKQSISCECVSTSDSALSKSFKSKPELIFLDIEVDENMDGFQICEQLRNNKLLDNSIISFLSPQDENYAKISAYKAGADDYISTPINSHLFLHKVKALTKRIHSQSSQEQNTNESHSVFWKNKSIDLTPKEFAILNLMLSDSKKVFSRQEIQKSVWMDLENILPRTIDVHIRKLRSKLGKSSIFSVKGIGYRINVS